MTRAAAIRSAGAVRQFAPPADARADDEDSLLRGSGTGHSSENREVFVSCFFVVRIFVQWGKFGFLQVASQSRRCFLKTDVSAALYPLFTGSDRATGVSSVFLLLVFCFFVVVVVFSWGAVFDGCFHC